MNQEEKEILQLLMEKSTECDAEREVGTFTFALRLGAKLMCDIFLTDDIL